MPTILELFKGSNKDITPKGLDQTPVQDKFAGSTQEKSVKSTQISKIEQEVKGVRFRSGVELNNPLLYGNQAIRIATRSTSDVEKMKQATGGSAGDGGLIGKGLGAITGGKFGQFVFGGKVTSLNQARDGVNSRLGIPTNLIPTNVYNTGGLQAGIEPDTMITLSKIKTDGSGTLLGKFLKQTGGGTPKTIGNQVLGGGISLLKNKLRTTLFGNPNTMGSNNVTATDSFSGLYGSKTPANGGWEYSSKLPYSKQISTAKFNTKSVDGYAEGTSKDITKKITDLQLDAKKKLGQASKNATDFLKKQLKGTESKSEIDKAVESKTKVTTATAKTYSEQMDGYKTEDVTERIDLSLVSPIKGINRKDSKGLFGKTEYGFRAPNDNTGKVMPNDPTRNYTSVVKNVLENKYGLTSNRGDGVNKVLDGGSKDLIPVKMKGVTDKDWVSFRALITGFSETVSPEWNSSKFVGNPYNFYTYSGVERSASFNLKLYCMNIQELDMMWKRIDWLTKKAYPAITDKKLVNAPFIDLTLGSIYVQKTGFINSLSYQIADDITWETASNNWLPKVVDVQIEFKIVDFAGQENKVYGLRLSQEATKALNQRRQETGAPSVSPNPITQPTAPTPAPAASTPAPTTTPSSITTQTFTFVPPKIDASGVEQKPTPPSENSKPKSIETGKPTETPKQANDPSTLTAMAMVSITDAADKRQKAVEKYKGKGYPDWLVQVLADSEADGTKISNIQKLEENSYYLEKEYVEDPGDIYEKVHEKVENGVDLVSYQKWVTKHNGKDPLNKFFSKDQTNKIQSTGKLQTASPF